MKQDVVLLESYTSEQNGGLLNDFVAVFSRTDRARRHPARILHQLKRFSNGYPYGETETKNPLPVTEDQRNIRAIQQFLRTSWLRSDWPPGGRPGADVQGQVDVFHEVARSRGALACQ